ncbi:MAG: two-component sensor histidine kinase [Rhizobiales bacterium]|nr:two-component sensor histidine kinase [Hyphomicrobiales bacterium]
MLMGVAIWLEAGGTLIGLAMLNLVLMVGLVRPRSRTPSPPPLRIAGHEASPEFRQALDALPSPTILTDRRAVVVYANPASTTAFPGLRAGFPLSAAMRDPDLLAALERVQKGEREATIELIERVPLERSFSVTIRRMEGDDVVLVSLTDTTKARQVERMRADFVANASHELRTPLASILGFVETLQGPAKADEAARTRFLDIVATQARRMTRLINDLLSLSRLEMNAHIRPSERVDLRPLVLHLFDVLGGLASERGVRLEHDFEEGAELAVTGDRDELMRLVENLIENAIKYGGSGGRVDAQLRREGHEIFLSIRDFGPGIAPEHIPRLTERFYRVNTEESRVQGGTGLGLAICKHIVTRHRGRLEIESPGQAGTVTRIVLPAYKIDQ